MAIRTVDIDHIHKKPFIVDASFVIILLQTTFLQIQAKTTVLCKFVLFRGIYRYLPGYKSK